MNGIKSMRVPKFRPQLSLRHVNSPVSPPPDQNIGIICSGVVPREFSIQGQLSKTQEFRTRISKADSKSSSMTQGRNIFTGYHKAANIYSLPPIRSKTSRSLQSQEMPKIYICPAPKFIKQNRQTNKWEKGRPQKTYYHRQRTTQSQPGRFPEFKPSTTPYMDVPVTIPVQHGTSPVDDRYHEATEVIERTINVTPENVVLRNVENVGRTPKTVNLNESFEAVSARYGGEISLHVALSRKQVGKKFKNSKSKPTQETAPRHLPLREVYLKPDIVQDKESYARYQQEKMLRIWSWLKKLNYLDESQLMEQQAKTESVG